MDTFSKSEKREIRRLAGIAHERELATATGALQSEFEKWRRGEISVFELNDQIHKFHDGISRDLYKGYVMADPVLCLASAVARGVIQESEVAPLILERLLPAFGLFRD